MSTGLAALVFACVLCTPYASTSALGEHMDIYLTNLAMFALPIFILSRFLFVSASFGENNPHAMPGAFFSPKLRLCFFVFLCWMIHVKKCEAMLVL